MSTLLNRLNQSVEIPNIIGFSTLAAIIYGIAHDMVTAHMNVEYFTIAHPPMFDTTSPFLLAIGWGIVATWWVGLPLGILLAVAARFGPMPKLRLGDIRRSVLLLMATSYVIAMVSGVIGYLSITHGGGEPTNGWGCCIDKDLWAAFTFNSYAHMASYVTGAVGGLFVVGYTVARRYRLYRAAQANPA